MANAANNSKNDVIIYPIHTLDNAREYRKLFMSYIFRFNSVLDGQKLADALSKLLETNDWKKLGGRLHVNKDGKLEIHVAQQGTPQSTRVAFSQQQVDASVNDTRSLGGRLPALTGGDVVQQLSPADLHVFSSAEDAPKSLEAMMACNASLLSLRVTNFTDATVVAISWPHPLMDAVGLQALMRNWSLVVNDKPEQIQPVLGAHTDFVQKAVDQDCELKEPLFIEKMALGVWGIVLFLFRFMYIKLWEPAFEERTMLLPQETVDKLCAEARTDLVNNGNEKSKQTVAFISEGDVLAAWAAQMLAVSQPTPRPVTVASFINLRFRLSALQEKGGEFIQNLLQFVYISLQPSCGSAPLGVTALDYRQQLMQQSTQAQVYSYLNMQLQHVRKNGKLRLVFGQPRADMLTVNNLAKIDFFRNIDFAGALVASADDADDTSSTPSTEQATTVNPKRNPKRNPNPPGKIVYFHPLVLNDAGAVTSHLRILGRDHNNRLLMTGAFQPRTWDSIVEYLASIH